MILGNGPDTEGLSQKYRELKKAYNQAKAEGKETFMFEGQEMLVAFVKYLLEYLGEKYKHELKEK